MMQKIDYKIDYATSADCIFISQLENENFSSPWSLSQIESEILRADCYFFVARCGSEVIGYISGQLILDEFYISNIAVSSLYRKLGVASALINRLLSTLTEINCVFATLEVRYSNLPARSLYEKLGFELLGKRKSFYTKPTEDACIYTYYFKNEVN